MSVPAAVGDPAAHGGGPQTPAPRGPGVNPPFVAPPTDRDNKSLWLWLGIGGLVLVLCCVGGLVGVGLLFAGSSQELRAQARQTVAGYLRALVREDYSAAYRMLCRDVTDQEPEQSFVRRSSRDRLAAYSVGGARIVDSDFVVTATLRYLGSGEQIREYVVQSDLGEMTVCGGD